ncbi:MAG: GyrI-like domain-containing protein [Eubacteriales bacterium]
MDKVDYKKDFKDLYLPKKTPIIISIPSMNFLMIDGKGDPNEEDFALKVEALYTLSYAVKMSYKKEHAPQDYYHYTVFPLEGVWDLFDKNLSPRIKSNFLYTIMIRQPDFLTSDLFNKFLSEVKLKKTNSNFDKVKFGTVSEGLCCQMMHVGSYDNEPESFNIMEQYAADKGYNRIYKTHREIYLSDPRRTDPAKLKTVLRFNIESN